ncbi:MAG: aspartyl protease [Leptolyngbyaceae cyanobacterium RU_5_1]|nr:aspartyl protease [Leptolyngbyaceae cyanobacterium RU_5_1]
MSKHFCSRAMLLMLSSAMLLSGTACSRERVSQPIASNPAAPPSSPGATSASPAPSPAVAPVPVLPDSYKSALQKAESASNLGQSALSEDDWNLVASRWQQAIALLKSIPASSPYQARVKAKLTEYEKGLAIAQKRAGRAKADIEQAIDPGALAKGGSESLNVSSAIASNSAASGTVYRAPIKRRAGGTPVIDVTFNGNQTFEMIVDTGASGTVITEEMAQALGVRIIGKTKVNTASQTGVEVPLAYVESIAVGGAVVKEVIVAIANSALDIGLLGHDFFSNYDVTVKQDVVEFRKR